MTATAEYHDYAQDPDWISEAEYYSGAPSDPDAPVQFSPRGLAFVTEAMQRPAVDALGGVQTVHRWVDQGVQVPADVLLDGIVSIQRILSVGHGLAAGLTAELGRLGVAVPETDVRDAVEHRGSVTGGHPDPAGATGADGTDESGDHGGRAAAGAVFGDPAWDAELAAEAVALAAPELAAALQVANPTAVGRIVDAQELVDELPLTYRALLDGRIDGYRVKLIAAALRDVEDPQLRASAEAMIVERAVRGMTPGDLGRLAVKIVHDVDPAASERRASRAHARRGTWVRSLGDGLASFHADLSVEDAALAHGLFDGLAGGMPPECRAGRGRSQLRADIFADVCGQLADTGVLDLRALTGPVPDNHHADTDPYPDAAGCGQVAEPEPAGCGPVAEPEPAGCRPVAEPNPAGCGPVAEPEPTEPAGSVVVPEPVATDAQASPIPGPESSGTPWVAPPDPDEDRRAGMLASVRLPRGLRVNLDVTVALSTLAGVDDLGALLKGHGVIGAELARALTRAAGTVRLLVTGTPGTRYHQSPGAEAGDCPRCTIDSAAGSRPAGTEPPPTDSAGSDLAGSHRTGAHAEPGDDPPAGQPTNNGGRHRGGLDCGTVLDFGRTAYRVPAATADRVKTRDQRCRFPGCGQPAVRCHHDHHIPWDQGGATCPCDLDTLCITHHRVKTFTTWHATRHLDNVLTWTSPLGRTYRDHPAPDLPIENPPWIRGSTTSADPTGSAGGAGGTGWIAALGRADGTGGDEPAGTTWADDEPPF